MHYRMKSCVVKERDSPDVTGVPRPLWNAREHLHREYGNGHALPVARRRESRVVSDAGPVVEPLDHLDIHERLSLI